MIGRRLQHYEIVEKLGEGGMGVVYKARDGHLGRLVAIKVLPPDKLADGVRKARFTQEAKAASALNHPNIVTIFDISSDEGCDFIAMEYVAGRTLEQLIGRRGLGLNEALKIAIQMADALARAHSTGIVHRDLKPSNVMVDEHGLVKILDFGVAKLTEPLPAGDDASTQTVKAATEEGTILGTAAYMSPEQAEGKSVDARSDIFSFGTVLYEMVSGRRAFEGDSMMPALSAVLHQEPKPVKDVPRDLEKIITRCLKKDPERRFQFMKDLRIELEELKEESDSGRLAAVSEAPVKGRRWSWVGGLAAAAVLVGIGALWRFWPLASTGQGGSPPSLQQLTSYVGFELSPTFSPDGKQVAFTWEGEKRDNWDIYVKLVGESNAVRLTSDAAPDTVPAWSPDGSRIAFQRRRRGAPGIWLVSPLGGGEEKIADLRVIGHMSWSPDGKWLAAALGGERGNVGHERGIVLIPLGGGEPLRVTNPKAPAYDVNPDFSGDGRQLAYATCASKWSCDVFVQALGPRYAPEGAPRRITTSGLYIDGIAWLRDGESLIYSGSRSWGMTPRLWRVRLHGGQEQERLDVAGFQARQPAVWRGGDRLAFNRMAANYDIWRYQEGGVPKPFLASSLHEYTGEFSPDGRRIAFSSGRSGETIEVWIADADGSRLVQLTRDVGRGQGSPSWSPDGRLIAFDSLRQDGRSGILVVEADGGRPRGLTPEESSDAKASWSRDGKWIYFYSDRTGRSETWRVSPAGGPAEQVTSNGGEVALESTDGRTLFYLKSEEGPLFARLINAGEERQILEYVTYRAFTVVEEGIYFIGRRGPDNLFPVQFYEFATGKSRLLFKTQGPIQQGLSVSKDRKTILFSRSADAGSDLMLVDHFR